MPHDEPAERLIERERSTPMRTGRPPLMLARPRVKPGDPVADALVAALRGAVLRMAATDSEASRGDPEGIHRLRTSTRRLRSELKAFEDVVDSRWSAQLEQELKWLAGLLGGVRDLDILMGRLRKDAGAPDGPDALALAPLFSALQARHTSASSALKDALRSERYRGLLVALKRAIEHTELKDVAWESCRSALPPLAAAAWRRLRKRGRGLRQTDPDEDFHEVRKRVKRARYTAELVAPILGRCIEESAQRFIRLTTQVQDVLGEFHDAIVAAAEIEPELAQRGDDFMFVSAASRLLETQHAAAARARTAFFDVWAKLDRKKSTRWLKTGLKARSRTRS
jgi:CHAD domain-containing protein